MWLFQKSFIVKLKQHLLILIFYLAGMSTNIHSASKIIRSCTQAGGYKERISVQISFVIFILPPLDQFRFLFCWHSFFFSIFFCSVGLRSYEVLMLTSKCETCGLPERGFNAGNGNGLFPCGHPVSGNQRRRTSTLSTSSGVCLPATLESPIPSPTPSYLGVVARSATPYSPVKDSSKSLLASLCRYWLLPVLKTDFYRCFRIRQKKPRDWVLFLSGRFWLLSWVSTSTLSSSLSLSLSLFLL